MTGENSSPKSHNLEQADEVHHALLNLLLEGGGLNEVANELATFIGRPVLIANVAGATLAGQLSPAAQTRFVKLMSGAAHAHHRTRQSLETRAYRAELCLIPLVVQSEIEGFLVAGATQLGDLDKRILEQGATLATLALIKYQAVHKAEQRLRRDLLEDLLTGDPWSGERLAEQAQSLGWQFESKPVVILFDFSQARRYSLSERGLDQAQLRWVHEKFLKITRQILAEYSPLSIMAERHNGFIILPHLPTANVQQARQQAEALIEAIVQQVKAEGLKVGYAVAGGGFYSGVEGLRRSFHEAQQALEMSTRLMMRRLVWFDEVQLYLLLQHSSRSEDVRDWFRRTLGPLVEYDRRNKTDLLHTLEAYFDTNQRLQETAHTLHIHPNTLKYRLRRIKQILGQDPFNGENQLRFYLATKVARLL